MILAKLVLWYHILYCFFQNFYLTFFLLTKNRKNWYLPYYTYFQHSLSVFFALYQLFYVSYCTHATHDDLSNRSKPPMSLKLHNLLLTRQLIYAKDS